MANLSSNEKPIADEAVVSLSDQEVVRRLWLRPGPSVAESSTYPQHSFGHQLSERPIVERTGSGNSSQISR